MNKFLNNPQDKPFHSSGLARVAHGDAIGAASQQTFSQRAHVDRNRQHVNHYRESMVVRGKQAMPLMNPGAKIDVVKPFNRDRRSIRGMNNPSGATSGLQAPTPNAPRFVEPPTRGYNPYG